MSMSASSSLLSSRDQAHRSRNKPRVALALAGGGPLGAIYEIGALCALEEALGWSLNEAEHFVGVSAGGFIAAGLANGMTPRDLCQLFIASQPDSANDGMADVFDPAWLMRPAYKEWGYRLMQVPQLGVQSFWAWAHGQKSLIGALEKMAPVLPTGVFSNEEVDRQLARLFSQPGRSNDFRELSKRLTLVATHLDSGDAAPFGRPGWDHVPISRAIAASAALPGLFPPVEIDGRYYVDGALKKTMHATVALDEGVDVMFCLNPLVPFDATRPVFPRVGQHQAIPPMVDGGLPSVMNQTFRSLIHSRLELGMKQYEHAYPDATIVLIEPDHRDPEMFLANTFSYRQRHTLAEHAYQQTRQLLRNQFTTLNSKLQGHGLGLNHDGLFDLNKQLLSSTSLSSSSSSSGSQRRLQRLNTAIERLQDNLNDLHHAIEQGVVTRRR